MYILRDLLMDGEHRAPIADVAPAPSTPRADTGVVGNDGRLLRSGGGASKPLC